MHPDDVFFAVNCCLQPVENLLPPICPLPGFFIEKSRHPYAGAEGKQENIVKNQSQSIDFSPGTAGSDKCKVNPGNYPYFTIFATLCKKGVALIGCKQAMWDPIFVPLQSYFYATYPDG